MFLLILSDMIPGAIEPRQCPLGYREYSGSLRRTFEETCEPCPPGYYGAHPNRTTCTPCRAGVVCKIGATTDDPVSNSSSVAAQLGYETTSSYLCPPGGCLNQVYVSRLLESAGILPFSCQERRGDDSPG